MSTQTTPTVPTDKQKLVALLSEFGVGFSDQPSQDSGSSVECHKGQEKVAGYGGFYTEFKFDANGKFIEMACWE